jgi:superfamily II DNA or RNA helicase
MDTVLTVDKFNEGIDVPEANIIVFLRSTASKTIFFQQLGRGLRHAVGKEKVIILDYVANCNRLEMVYALWRQVRNRRGELGLSNQHLPFSVCARSGTKSFDESMRKVLGLIAEVRDDFGRKTDRRREKLLGQIKYLARQLGKEALKAQDVVRGFERGWCASDATFRSYFGTIENAVNSAGLQFERGIGGRPAKI